MRFLRLSGLPFVTVALVALGPLPEQAGSPTAQVTPKFEVSSALTSALMAGRSAKIPVLESTGWRTPRPPYPYQARAAHEQGETYVQVTTGAAGTVVRAVIPKDSKHPLLEQNSANYILHNWHGPPNKTVTVTLLYRLQ